jgi:hypothetical protein
MNIQDYPNFAKALEQVGIFVMDEYKSQLEKRDKRGYNAIASGQLRDSVKYKIKSDGNFIQLYLQLADHWIRVEYDQKWNKGKMPPVHDLRIWMSQKGLPLDEKIEWKIRNKIFKDGTKGRHFLKNTIEELDKSNWKQILIIALQKDMNSRLKGVFLNKEIK